MIVLGTLPTKFYDVGFGKFDTYADAISWGLQISSIIFIIGVILAIPYIAYTYCNYKQQKNLNLFNSYVEYVKLLHKIDIQLYTSFVGAVFFVGFIFLLWAFGVFLYGCLYI